MCSLFPWQHGISYLFSATFVFKILHDEVDSSILKDNIEIINNRLTRVSRYLKEKHYSTNYGVNNSLNRAISLFNSKISCYDKNNIIL
jgi:hypothetical protein